MNKGALFAGNVHTAASFTCVQMLLLSGCWPSRRIQRCCFTWSPDRLNSFTLWCLTPWPWPLMLLEGGTTGPTAMAAFTEVTDNTVARYTPVGSYRALFYRLFSCVQILSEGFLCKQADLNHGLLILYCISLSNFKLFIMIIRRTWNKRSCLWLADWKPVLD